MSNHEGEPKDVLLSLPPDEFEDLSLMALRHGLTKEQMIRQALHDRKYIDNKLDKDSRFQLIGRDGSRRELLFEVRNPDLSPDDLPET